MHPTLVETVAAERVKDMRREAIASERARLARRTRRSRRVLASTTAKAGVPRARGAAGHASANGAAPGHAG
jgi:hypothetical protein